MTGMRGVLAFEWIKLRSVRSTWWSLVAAGALTVLVSVVVGLSVKASEENGHDAAQPAPHTAADAMTLAQLGVVVLATLAVTSEYAGGTIGTTLRSVPSRGRVLAGKALVAMGVAAVAGVVLGVAGTAVAAPLMGEYGEFGGGEAAASVLGIAGYLAALAVLTVGVGTVLRSAAGTITGVLMLLLAIPQLMALAGASWLENAADWLPLAAGMVVMTQEPGAYGTGPAVAVLLAWALAPAVAGYAALRARDA